MKINNSRGLCILITLVVLSYITYNLADIYCNKTVNEMVNIPGLTNNVTNRERFRNVTTSYSSRRCYHLNWVQSDITPGVVAECGFIKIGESIGNSGNQMFQVAALFGIAHSLDLIPIIDSNFMLLQHYKLPNVIDIKLTNTKNCEPEIHQYYVKCTRPHSDIVNMTIYGYRQSWKYFKQIEDDIANIFRHQFTRPSEMKANKFLLTLPTNSTNIAVHIRRTDRLRDMELKGFAVGAEFYKKAMAFFQFFYNDINFVVLSDDMKWVKKNIVGDNIYYSPFEDKTDDLALMSKCDHVISAYSSFGWWGAWMANGTAVHYTERIKNITRICQVEEMGDYYTPGTCLIP